MISNRLQKRRLRAGVVTIFGLVAALFSPLAGGFGAHFASAAPLSSMPTVSVTVPAGDRAALEVRGFALQPGATLPQGSLSLSPQPFPSDRIRTALYYGVSWGYAQSDPQQVALALWWAQNGVWLSEDHTIAERIASATNGPGVPSWNADGRSIPALAAQGQLRISGLSLTPGTPSSYAGRGVLVLQNTGSQDIVVNLPYGTLFTGTSGSAIVWSVGQAQVPPASQISSTVAPAPAEPTNTNTNTPEPSATTPVKGKYNPNYTPIAEATATSVTSIPYSKGATQAPAPVATATQAPANNPPDVAPSQPSGVPNSSGGLPTNSDSNKAVEPKAVPQQQGMDAPAQPQGGDPSSGPAQTSGNEAPASDPAANGESAPPLPLSTPTATSGQGTTGAPAPPSPESTSAPGVDQSPPGPNPTSVDTLPGQGTGPATGSTVTPTESKKEEATPTSVAPPKVEPTEPPKANPTPIATTLPVPPPGPIVVPTIVTGGADPGGANNQGQTMSPGEQAPGTTPGSLATTGAGPSVVPLWLTLLSTIMVFGGWTLRRMSNIKPQPVPVVAEVVAEPEES